MTTKNNRGQRSDKSQAETRPPASDADELVDEASDESFPASDPPSFTPMHIGPPTSPKADLNKPRARKHDE